MSVLRSSHHRFLSPPVYETALAVQFEELLGFRSIHFGLFYSTIQDQFPFVEDQSRLQPILETFPPLPRNAGLQLVPNKGGPERVWYCDKTPATRLLQVQPDRFGLNWRRLSEAERYPSFEENGPLFLESLLAFESFCGSWNLGRLKPNLCEVVYVNQIFPQERESVIDCLEHVLEGVQVNPSEDLARAELVSLNRVYPIGERRGRLYIEAGIARHPERGDFVALKLTARILHREADVLSENLQMAHDAVVNGFVAATTATARANRWSYSHD